MFTVISDKSSLVGRICQDTITEVLLDTSMKTAGSPE